MVENVQTVALVQQASQMAFNTLQTGVIICIGAANIAEGCWVGLWAGERICGDPGRLKGRREVGGVGGGEAERRKQARLWHTQPPQTDSINSFINHSKIL